MHIHSKIDKMVNKMLLKRSSYLSGSLQVHQIDNCQHCSKTLVVDDNMFNIMSIQMMLTKVKTIPKGVDKALDG